MPLLTRYSVLKVFIVVAAPVFALITVISPYFLGKEWPNYEQTSPKAFFQDKLQEQFGEFKLEGMYQRTATSFKL